MKVSDDTRGERKASVLRAMKELRDKFPLQKVAFQRRLLKLP